MEQLAGRLMAVQAQAHSSRMGGWELTVGKAVPYPTGWLHSGGKAGIVTAHLCPFHLNTALGSSPQLSFLQSLEIPFAAFLPTWTGDLFCSSLLLPRPICCFSH